jgi:hypothetical protein
MLSMIFLAAVGFAMSATAQTPQPTPSALPMAEVRSCAIEFRDALPQGKWGGQIALYDATTDSRGVVVSLERRILEGREHLPPLVKLELWKGALPRRVELYQVNVSEAIKFSPGARYLIVAYRQTDSEREQFRTSPPAGMLGINVCASRSFEEAERYGDLRDLGPGRPLTE